MSPSDRPGVAGIPRSVRNGILLWVLVVGGVSTLGWLVIARAGEAASLLGSEPAPRAMTAPAAPGASPPSATVEARPSASGLAATSSGASPDGTHQGRSGTGAVRAVPGSTTTRGGSIGAACTGNTVTLSWVTPNQGWSNTHKIEDSALEVTFRDGEGSVEVKVRCSGGSPSFSIE